MCQNKKTILFVGSFTLDTTHFISNFNDGPKKYISRDPVITASGTAATGATAATRLGGDAALWASVGDDEAGRKIIEEIKKEGVNCSHVRKVKNGKTASGSIIVNETGDRWVIVNYDELTQSYPIEKDTPDFNEYSAVVADSRWYGASLTALKNAKKNNKPAIFDADVSDYETLKSLAQNSTHVIASFDGAKILSKQKNVESAAKIIADEFGCFVCITKGEDGVFWTNPNLLGVNYIPTPKAEVVDTNAAGDVFHAAFAVALVENKTIDYSLCFAHAAAALKCKVLGGRLGAPNLDKTIKFMRNVFPNQFPFKSKY